MSFSLVAGCVTLVAGCASQGSLGGGSCVADTDCPGAQVCAPDGRCELRGSDSGTERPDGSTTRPERRISEVRIEPTSADLVSTNGSMPEVDFTLYVTFEGESERQATGPEFAIDDPSIGTLDPASGGFVGNGIIGGTARVTGSVRDPATGEDRTAEATVTVSIARTHRAPDVPEDVETRFDAPVDDPARTAQVVYPLDGAVMPQNVAPADIQWLRGDSGDLFRVQILKPHVTAEAFLIHTGASFGNHYKVDDATWRSITQTDPDTAAEIVVDRFDGSDTVRSATRSVRFARAALTGSVYYWDIQRGRIVRIDDGTDEPVEFMPSPPLDASESRRCVGCHAVSNSGRYMAGRLGGGDNIGAVFDLTEDLSGESPPTTFDTNPSSARWWFSSWSPDDDRLVVSFNEGGPSPTREMRFLDPFAGTFIDVDGSPPSGITQPAWSPDGEQIAYVTNINRGGTNFTQGDIGLIAVTGRDAVGPSAVVHRASDLSSRGPGGNADSYPTWTPDSGRIAFAHGTGTRSEDQRATLYAMNRGGTNVVHLDRASGDGFTDFQPNFSPFDEDGYFWMTFLSRRDYGNAQAGTRGRGLQQIWVTAIRKDAPAGEDPSEVPYWLPGQRTTSRNISAFWAPRACRTDGESCSVGSECCGGDCRPDDTGALVCSPPPPERCRNENETCTTSADCCDALVCSGRVCITPVE